ncbi:MAG: hypothetical protein ACI9AQ_002246, partial [Dinoroseobacter sp.]
MLELAIRIPELPTRFTRLTHSQILRITHAQNTSRSRREFLAYISAAL